MPLRVMAVFLLAFTLLLLPAAWLARGQSEKKPSPEIEDTAVEMRNINFHLDATGFMHVRRMRGRLVPTKPGQPASFDDKDSFHLAIQSAETDIDGPSLSILMNKFVFAADDAPLKDIQVTIENGKLTQRGKLKKGVVIPFEMTGPVKASEDGRIMIHAEKIKAGKLPVKALLKVFGADLEKLNRSKMVEGVEYDDNDIYLDPEKIMPAPRIRGKLVAARIEGSRLIQVYGEAKPSAPSRRGNYFLCQGGTLRFGLLTMHPARLALMDSSPADPFDYFLDHYKEQLAGGYSKTALDGSLTTYMTDFNKLRSVAK